MVPDKLILLEYKEYQILHSQMTASLMLFAKNLNEKNKNNSNADDLMIAHEEATIILMSHGIFEREWYLEWKGWIGDAEASSEKD